MLDLKSKTSLQTNSNQERVYLSPPHMMGREREYLLDAFDSNWIAPLGPHVDAFEAEFAERVGMPHAAALSSCTAALHLALRMLGVEPDDEVFTSTLTFVATANAICYQGAKPVFVDSEKASWNMDPDRLESELRDRDRDPSGVLPKAIIVVDVMGQCANYHAIGEICANYEIPIIEDAAEALGASFDGVPAGSFGDIACFSFNGNKIITTSGGGMLVANNESYVTQARHLATQARHPAPHYQHTMTGYNYRMSNLVAAVGRGQLEKLDQIVEKRRANFDYYFRKLGDVPGIEFMPEPEECFLTRWLTCLTIEPALFGASNDDIRIALAAENIECRPIWKPMHLQPLFASAKCIGGEVSQQIFETGLCLPSGTCLTQADQDRVIDCFMRLHQSAG